MWRERLIIKNTVGGVIIELSKGKIIDTIKNLRMKREEDASQRMLKKQYYYLMSQHDPKGLFSIIEHVVSGIPK